MCDAGYFGMTCELKDYPHYVFENLRTTWYPYILIPIIAIAWLVVTTWKQRPEDSEGVADYIA